MEQQPAQSSQPLHQNPFHKTRYDNAMRDKNAMRYINNNANDAT
jgi:hypothetical protein